MSDRNGVPGQRQPAGGALERLPDARRPRTARHRRGAPRRGSPAWARRRSARRAARACWPPGRRSPRRRRSRAPCRPWALLKLGSSVMPTRAAASAHWRLRCSVGRDDGHAPDQPSPRAARWRCAARTSSCRRRAWPPRGSRAGWRVAVRARSPPPARRAACPPCPRAHARGRPAAAGRPPTRTRGSRGGEERARGGRHAPPLPGLRPKPHFRPPPEPLPPSFVVAVLRLAQPLVDLLADGADRELVRVPARHPDLAAERDDGLAADARSRGSSPCARSARTARGPPARPARWSPRAPARWSTCPGPRRTGRRVRCSEAGARSWRRSVRRGSDTSPGERPRWWARTGLRGPASPASPRTSRGSSRPAGGGSRRRRRRAP